MARPSVTSVVRVGAERVDRYATAIGMRLERPALLSFLFHAVFEDDAEIEAGLVHPQEGLTLARFRQFVEHLLHADYRFVAFDDLDGLDPAGRYAMVTLDDGYVNNVRVVPLLREFDVPATIFVSTNHVDRGRRFWWDAVYAERTRRGTPIADIEREIVHLKALAPSGIEQHLARELGAKALEPLGELDRPLRPDELRELAGESLVTVGNHTMDHAILTVLSDTEIEQQVCGAQRYLEALLGSPARAISYPNGDYDRRVLGATVNAGLTWGITTIRRKERFPIVGDRRLELGRFQLRRERDLTTQLDLLRSGIHVTNALRRLRARNGRR